MDDEDIIEQERKVAEDLAVILRAFAQEIEDEDEEN